MKNITYAQALNIAIDIMNDTNPEVANRLITLRDTMARRGSTSDEARAKANAKRKEKTAQNRAALMKDVLPILRDSLSRSENGLTAKELFTNSADNLPEDFTSAKVQYILLHEMTNEVSRIETKGKANIYILK